MSPDPMRVLVTVPWAQRLGGAEGMLCTWLEHVDPTRVTVHVVLLADGPLVGYLESIGVRTTVIDAGRLRHAGRGARAIGRLARLIRDERPDVVLNWTTKSHVYTALASVLSGARTPAIWWQHGIPERDVLDLVAAMLPTVAIGCSSHAVAKAQHRVAPWRDTFVVFPGIATPDNTGPEPGRDELEIPADATVVGIVGRIHPMKGQDLFVDVLGTLRSRGLNAHGLVVGSDAYGLAPEYAEGLDRQIDRLDLRSHVTITGYVPSATRYMPLMDVLISTSASEPFGIVLLEAMLSGVPVVATASEGPTEILRDGVSGVLVPDRSAPAIAEAVVNLISDPDRVARMTRHARARVATEFSATTMARRVEDELTKAARGTRRRRVGRTR